jgi:hypothetical protein
MVEAASCIHTGREPKRIECLMSGFGGELAEYAKRLVEENYHKVFFGGQFRWQKYAFIG